MKNGQNSLWCWKLKVKVQSYKLILHLSLSFLKRSHSYHPYWLTWGHTRSCLSPSLCRCHFQLCQLFVALLACLLRKNLSCRPDQFTDVHWRFKVHYPPTHHTRPRDKPFPKIGPTSLTLAQSWDKACPTLFVRGWEGLSSAKQRIFAPRIYHFALAVSSTLSKLLFLLRLSHNKQSEPDLIMAVLF